MSISPEYVEQISIQPAEVRDSRVKWALITACFYNSSVVHSSSAADCHVSNRCRDTLRRGQARKGGVCPCLREIALRSPPEGGVDLSPAKP